MKDFKELFSEEIPEHEKYPEITSAELFRQIDAFNASHVLIKNDGNVIGGEISPEELLKLTDPNFLCDEIDLEISVFSDEYSEEDIFNDLTEEYSDQRKSFNFNTDEYIGGIYEINYGHISDADLTAPINA